MGMSHRGRLNVLANIIGKSYQDIFREFEDLDADLYTNRGDVKYHLGYHNYFTTASGREVHVSLGFNPSQDRKSTRLNSSHIPLSRMPSSA